MIVPRVMLTWFTQHIGIFSSARGGNNFDSSPDGLGILQTRMAKLYTISAHLQTIWYKLHISSLLTPISGRVILPIDALRHDINEDKYTGTNLEEIYT